MFVERFRFHPNAWRRSFMAEAGRVLDWNGRYTLTYPQYLTAKGYERSIHGALDRQTSDLVHANHAAIERLASDIGDALHDTADSIGSAFQTVSEGLDGIHEAVERVDHSVSIGFRAVGAALYWGFEGLARGQARLSNQMDALIELTSQPSHVWASDRFRLAEEAKRQQMYEEALAYVKQAIWGFGSNAGVSTDWRYHFLLGDVLLGDFSNTSADIIDLDGAEAAFVTAGKCAAAYNSLYSGRAYVLAGRAALIAGRASDALSHTLKGIAATPRHAQGHYQAARLFSQLNNFKDAVPHLARAVEINFALLASARLEPDFQSASVIEKALKESEQHFKTVILSRVNLVRSRIDMLISSDLPCSTPDELVSDNLGIVSSKLEEYRSLASSDQLGAEELQRAGAALTRFADEITQLGRHLKLRCREHIAGILADVDSQIGTRQRDIQATEREIEKLKADKINDIRLARLLPAVLMWLVLGVFICKIIFVDFKQFTTTGFQDDSAAIGTIISWPLFLWIILSACSWLTNQSVIETKRANEAEMGFSRGQIKEKLAVLCTSQAHKAKLASDLVTVQSLPLPTLSRNELEGCGLISDQS